MLVGDLIKVNLHSEVRNVIRRGLWEAHGQLGVITRLGHPLLDVSAQVLLLNGKEDWFKLDELKVQNESR